MARLTQKEIAEKWQKRWEDSKIFKVEKNAKKKFYVLEMFPYPSSSGLHMGHALNYTIGDIFARYKRMNGFNVLHPMGFDSFGLPAENAAIKAKAHPKKFTEDAIKNYIKQMKGLGISYDWDRMVETHKEDYYKWDQWIFLKMFEKGLAYKKTSPVNWCAKCNTVLANEQVHNGKCWRHEDTEVEVKNLDQWFFKTTAYAEELYDGIDKLEGWPDLIKKLQKNWINKSYGAEIVFKINGEDWKVFTTRPDTLMGVTFLVISAQHPRLNELTTKENKTKVEAFVKSLHSVKEEDVDQMEKQGVFTGSHAVHPITGEQIPVFAGNFVLADYGSGMVMAVPAHDQRDFEFAKKYKIPIKYVIAKKFGTVHKGEIKRESITAVVQRKSDKKFLYLKWKEFNWVAPVVGGIEKNETPEKAAEREVFEETGYKVKAIRKLGGPIDIHMYVDHKKIYRHQINQPILLELVDDIQTKVDTSESKQHESIWLSLDEARKKTTHPYNLTGLNTYVEEETAYTEPGVLVNSDKFDSLDNEEAKKVIVKELEKKNLGKQTVNYRLRDWLISRQRFWGTPIPIVYCEKCGAVPVKEKDLPVRLPDNVKFESAENPLREHENFLNTSCPKCGGKAKRETDTMDTFVNSSWYYLRYSDPKNSEQPFSPQKADYWCPIDQYIGGKEHACMHLIYIRFYTKFLRDLGLLNFDEPAINLFNQGMLQGPDGEKMSKSKGNVILPEVISEKYGLDSARLFLVSVASPDKDINWSNQGTEGSARFIKRIFDYTETVKFGKTSEKTQSKLHNTIKQVGELIESFKYNIATIKIRELFDSFEQEISKKDFESFLKLLSPICPHITEELWENIGNKTFISAESWPKFDESKINEKLDYFDEIIEGLRGDVIDVMRLIKVDKSAEIKFIVSHTWKYDLIKMFKELTKDSFNQTEVIQKIMSSDLKKYGQEVMKLVPSFFKDASKLSKQEITQIEEKKLLEDHIDFFKKEFGAKIIIELAESSKEQKAKNALPGKPAILIK